MNDNFKNTILGIVTNTASKELLHNNANKASERIPVMRDMIAGEVAKEIALNDILPKHIAEAHILGDIHYHDLDYAPLVPMYNCMLIDLKGMLENGFNMGNAEIETPKSISTACAITAQIIAQVASHIYGGNTINRIDEVLAPYVRKSYDKHHRQGRLWLKDEAKASVYATKMTEKETYDAFQALEYEINTLHTANGQTPFCTFGFGIGTDWEERIIQESILKVRIAGLGKSKRTAVFPKLVFAIKKGVNFSKDDVNYDIKQLALECASKRMYPDILNYDKLVEVTGGFKNPMGCRSFLSEYDNTYDGRNNLGVISLNLVRIGILSGGDVNTFFHILEEKLDICKEALDTRIAALEGVKASIAPILYMEGACGVRLKADDPIMPIFKDGRATLSLGYIGLHELVNAMFPNEPHAADSVKKQQFARNVLECMKAHTMVWKEENGFGYGLYSTPSESLCDRFCRLDKGMFGVIAGVTDKGYYTNSFHLDVLKKVTPTEKIDFEAGYPELASGGFISYVEFPNMKLNLKGLEHVWDYTYDKLPYFGTNTPVDYCGKCDFAGEARATKDGFVCPTCGNKDQGTLSVTRRVCGYLGAPNARPYIEGKQLEVINRVKHTG